MSKRLRPLLPVPEDQPGQPSTPITPLNHSSDSKIKRKRVGNQLACNGCRKRKTRCDGSRPQCESCHRRREEGPCVYEEPRQNVLDEPVSQSLALLDLLRAVPESQSYDILRVLRSTDDPSIALRLIKELKGQNKHTEDHSEARSSMWQLGLAFELTARNPVVYPPQWHLIYDPISAVLGGSEVNGDASRSSAAFESSATTTQNTLLIDSRPTAEPTPIPALCDERLRDLDMSRWVSMPISNMLAAHVISLYLQTDHPLLGTFDPDLFVGDLVHGRTQFCSQFLVHTIMYWGCQMYSTLDPQASTYIAFFAQASEHMWVKEKKRDCILNLASIQLLCMSLLGDGKDHIVLVLVAEANTMATRMGLIGDDLATAAMKTKELSADVKSATLYAAWGTFNWTILMSLFYQQPGLTYPEHSPTLPVPMSVKYSRDNNAELLPKPSESYMGDTFPTLCQFWKIIHEVTLRYYRDNPPPRRQLSDHISLSFAEYKYRELLAWTETLPESMMQSDDSPHHVIIFHIWFHAAVLDILRPFTTKAQGSRRPLRLKTFSARKSSVDAAFKASVNQLKRLVVAIRCKYTCSAYTMLWHTALIYLSNAILQNAENVKDPMWHFYLLFCIHCYETLRQSYRFAESVGRGLLAMVLQAGDISADEARRIMVQFQEKGMGQAAKDIRATFMVDLSLGMTDPKQASVESLADRFEDVVLFQEFMNQDIQDEEYVLGSEDE